MKKNYLIIGLFSLLIFASIITRYSNLGYRSLWCDEAWRAVKTREAGFIPQSEVRADPPLQYFIRKLIVREGGDEFYFRFPSVNYGIISIPVVYAAVSSLCMNPFAGLYASALIATNDNEWAISRDMNIYAGESLAITLLMTALILLMNHQFTPVRSFAGFMLIGFSIGLGHTAAILSIPSVVFVLIWRIRELLQEKITRKQFMPNLFITIGTILLIIIWYYGWVKGIPSGHREYTVTYYAAAGDMPQPDSNFFSRFLWVWKQFFLFLISMYPYDTKPAKILWIVFMASTCCGSYYRTKNYGTWHLK